MACKRAFVYRNLGVMLDAGVPVLKALKTGTSGRDKMSRGVRSIIDDVAKGDSLAAAMRKKPKVFQPLDVMLIESGEKSGNLSEMLGELGRWYEFRNTLKKNIISGMTLPMVIFHAAAFIPPILKVLAGIISPHISEVTTGEFIWDVWFTLQFLYIPVAVIIGIVFFTPQTGPMRFILDKVTLKIPILARAMRSLGFCRFCRSFSMLYNSGTQISDDVRMAAAVTGNQIIGRMFRGGEQSALEGQPVSEGFSHHLPVEFLDVWRVGEESGKLYDASKRLAKIYQEAAEFWFDQIAKWVPKIIYVIICIFIAIKIIQMAMAIIGQLNSLM